MLYTFDATVLFLQRRISFFTLRRALRERPAAVCGRGGNWIICRETARAFFGVE